jgi:Integrase core domain
VEILNLLDDHSRVCVGSDAQRVFKAGDVDDCFGNAATRYGDPATVLSDNGAVFTGRSRGQGRVALEVTLARRGIRFRHSRPDHPQTCGKVERFHQTLKKWLTTRPRARTLRQLQAQLDSFRGYYNTQRPHRALGRRTPIQAYQARPKAVPTGLPWRTPTTASATTRSTQRRLHPAPQQPAPPHRRRPPPRRHRHPHPGPRAATVAPTRRCCDDPLNLGEAARHLCTVSRDITSVPLAGLEPATCCLGDNCRSSVLYGSVGSSQVRLGGVSGECGLVRFSCGLWNDRENDQQCKQRVRYAGPDSASLAGSVVGFHAVRTGTLRNFRVSSDGRPE